MALPQIWPGTRLPKDEWPTIWDAVCRHGLGLPDVVVRDWSLDDASAFLTNLDQRVFFACLETELEAAPFASLAAPTQVTSAIQELFDQEQMEGFAFAVLPTDFDWCIIGNNDGEIFFTERA